MLYLVLTIIFTAWLMVVFKLFQRYGVDSLHAIIINYNVCVVTGCLSGTNVSEMWQLDFSQSWVQHSLLTGLIFLPIFYLTSQAVRKINLSLVTLAGKISLLIPVLAGIIVAEAWDKLNFWYVSGLSLGILAIVLSSMGKGNQNTVPIAMVLLLSLGVFFGAGMVDVSIFLMNHIHAFTPAQQGQFSVLVFLTASVMGWLVLAYQAFFMGKTLKWRSVLGGLALGIPNFFSIYFLLKSLTGLFENNSALFYPILNISVILVNALVAWWYFKEEFTPVKWIGMAFAVMALVFLIKA